MKESLYKYLITAVFCNHTRNYFYVDKYLCLFLNAYMLRTPAKRHNEKRQNFNICG